MSVFMSRLLTSSEIQSLSALETKKPQKVFTSLVFRHLTDMP